MIVKTSVINFRLALGTLIAAIIALAAFGFSEWRDLESHVNFLSQDRKLLQQELDEFIERYDELSLDNQSLKSQVSEAENNMELATDSISILKAETLLLNKANARLRILKKQSETSLNGSLKKEIEDLQSQNELIRSQLDELNQLNTALQSENDQLAKVIKKAEHVRAYALDAKVFRKKASGEVVETDKAKHADSFEVCFSLAENPLADSGTKSLYIQILGPDSNVVNDKGSVEFGEQSLIYSSMIEVEYDNQNQEICRLIPNNNSFKKGIYYLSVFEKDQLLGSMQIALN